MSGARRISGSFDSTADRLKVQDAKDDGDDGDEEAVGKSRPARSGQVARTLAARGPRQQRRDDRDDRPDRYERPWRFAEEVRLGREFRRPRLEEPRDGRVDVSTRSRAALRGVRRSFSRGPSVMARVSYRSGFDRSGRRDSMGSDAHPRQVETVVVGAGQAGLVMSSFLSDAGREHVLLGRRDTLGGGGQLNETSSHVRRRGQRRPVPRRTLVRGARKTGSGLDEPRPGLD